MTLISIYQTKKACAVTHASTPRPRELNPRATKLDYLLLVFLARKGNSHAKNYKTKWRLQWN